MQSSYFLSSFLMGSSWFYSKQKVGLEILTVLPLYCEVKKKEESPKIATTGWWCSTNHQGPNILLFFLTPLYLTLVAFTFSRCSSCGWLLELQQSSPYSRGKERTEIKKGLPSYLPFYKDSTSVLLCFFFLISLPKQIATSSYRVG